MAASSVFQRSSWKFDHDTPTTMSLAIAATDMTLVDASRVAPIMRVLMDFINIPPLTVPTDLSPLQAAISGVRSGVAATLAAEATNAQPPPRTDARHVLPRAPISGQPETRASPEAKRRAMPAGADL